MKKSIFILSIILFGLVTSFVAQPGDSFSRINDSTVQAKVNKKKIYSAPRRAAIMSAILPGLGQIYNKKVWKVPIIYAGLGGFAYLFYTNNSEYNNYRHALISSQLEIKGDPIGFATVDNRIYTTDQLKLQKNYYKKYRDFGIIGMGIMYLINIIDANVDGHLKTFDVTDDLSVHLDVWQNSYAQSNLNYQTATGLSIKLNFK